MPSLEFDDWDIINLLAATPCTREQTQFLLLHNYDMRVPKASFESMWNRLEDHLGTDRAVYVVCDLVLTTANERLINALNQYDTNGEINVRINEPKIIDLLFDWDGCPTDLGQILLEYRRLRSLPEQEAHTIDDSDNKTMESAIDSIQTHAKLSDLETTESEVPLSASPGRGWRLERVRASSGTFFKAKSHWKERDLEDFIVAHWTEIDFGFDIPLRLVGRQIRLSGTREKVDLLAEMSDGTKIALELKIVQANGADFTQLLSYLQDLAFAGTPEDKIMGLLIAPSFAEKVLKAAGADRRIALLRFIIE